jgi:hypothetical protein
MTGDYLGSGDGLLLRVADETGERAGGDALRGCAGGRPEQCAARDEDERSNGGIREAQQALHAINSRALERCTPVHDI